MNIVRVVKGNDVSLSVCDKVLCFVTDFKVSEIVNEYEIREILSDKCVDTVNKEKKYTIKITALSHFDDSVFENDGFTLKARCDSFSHEYLLCKLVKIEKEMNENKPILNSYTIEAESMRNVA